MNTEMNSGLNTDRAKHRRPVPRAEYVRHATPLCVQRNVGLSGVPALA
jgi:hypothetical protein